MMQDNIQRIKKKIIEVMMENPVLDTFKPITEGSIVEKLSKAGVKVASKTLKFCLGELVEENVIVVIPWYMLRNNSLTKIHVWKMYGVDISKDMKWSQPVRKNKQGFLKRRARARGSTSTVLYKRSNRFRAGARNPGEAQVNNRSKNLSY